MIKRYRWISVSQLTVCGFLVLLSFNRHPDLSEILLDASNAAEQFLVKSNFETQDTHGFRPRDFRRAYWLVFAAYGKQFTLGQLRDALKQEGPSPAAILYDSCHKPFARQTQEIYTQTGLSAHTRTATRPSLQQFEDQLLTLSDAEKLILFFNSELWKCIISSTKENESLFYMDLPPPSGAYRSDFVEMYFGINLFDISDQIDLLLTIVSKDLKRSFFQQKYEIKIDSLMTNGDPILIRTKSYESFLSQHFSEREMAFITYYEMSIFPLFAELTWEFAGTDTKRVDEGYKVYYYHVENYTDIKLFRLAIEILDEHIRSRPERSKLDLKQWDKEIKLEKDLFDALDTNTYALLNALDDYSLNEKWSWSRALEFMEKESSIRFFQIEIPKHYLHVVLPTALICLTFLLLSITTTVHNAIKQHNTKDLLSDWFWLSPSLTSGVLALMAVSSPLFVIILTTINDFSVPKLLLAVFILVLQLKLIWCLCQILKIYRNMKKRPSSRIFGKRR